MKTCVIGDIHGCLGPLTNLLDMVVDRAETLIFLGDYVDRGPESQQVIETLLQLKKKSGLRLVFLKGNHELMLYNYLTGVDRSIFLRVGGLQTLNSYNIAINQEGNLLGCLPATHRTFFESLSLTHEDRHAIYVHAGLQPGVHLSRQSPDWCLWVRDRFIRSSFSFGKPVIFGHTVFTNPLIENNKIGIDTGAVYGGKLTALLLPDMEFIQVDGEQRHPFPSSL
ncbi:MAG TPA: serine/threonine protein phosphatase [Desulfobulbus sp.]|nr:serine/threonine protein phosphatase [Desulfobulbus sp.]